ncbi:MAG: KH domain-containing protein [Chthonomonas sp.]|nr:KH domain-containing protein [Chthonomonas sp.]
MEVLEFSAKSLDEARNTAATKFGVDASDVTVEVLEETKGLFGKVTLKVKASVGSGAPAKAEKKPAAAAKAPRAKKAEATPVEEPVVEEAAPAAEKPARKPARGKAATAKEAPAAEEKSGSDDEEERAEYTATDEDGEKLLGALKGILDAGDVKAVVEVTSIKGRYVNLKIDGKDAGHLVGKHGEVLNSLQYLLNVIGSKTLGLHARATLDGNDYRKRREDALTKHATDIAQQVIENQMEAVLDALPAFERRVVHKALSELEGISTYSEGEEPNRRVVISPL